MIGNVRPSVVQRQYTGATGEFGTRRLQAEDEFIADLAALPGYRCELASRRAGRINLYHDGPLSGGLPQAPLLLIHSVNAAASSYEMQPLYLYFRENRPVYALDLPGFGLSERTVRAYTPRLMTDAIHAAVMHIRSQHGAVPIDAMALSLSAEFLARAAIEAPARFRTLGLISPTGFDRPHLRYGREGGTLGKPWLLKLINRHPWRRALFDLLTRRAVIRRFLQKTWGSTTIDPGLLEYDYEICRPAGAENAPLYFIAGYLFGADSGHLYRALQLPVWMAHGHRGDFADFRGLRDLRDRSNWHIDAFDTGAMPHFQRPALFVARYVHWQARIEALQATQFGSQSTDLAAAAVIAG